MATLKKIFRLNKVVLQVSILLSVVPTTSETATDLPILRPSDPTDVGLIIGSATAGVVVIIVTILTIVIVIAVLSKKYGKSTTGYSVELKNEAVVITANQAGGLTHQTQQEWNRVTSTTTQNLT